MHLFDPSQHFSCSGIIAEGYPVSCGQAMAFNLYLERTADDAEFDRYRDHIKMRLLETAYERAYGLQRTYAEVITAHRADIQFAVEFLSNSSNLP